MISATIIDNISKGSLKAFKVFFDQYYMRVRNFANGIVRNTVSLMPHQRRRIFIMSRYLHLNNDEIAARLKGKVTDRSGEREYFMSER